MATSRMARRNLARQNLNTARKDAKGKLVTSGLNEIAGLVEFGLEATANNRSAYDAFEKGAEELGIEMDSGSGVMGKVKNFMTRSFTNPDKMMDKEFYSDDSRVYTGADVSFMGRMKSSKDPQVQMTLANLQKDGASLSEALNIGQDIKGGMSESDMEFKAKLSAQRRGGSGRYGKLGAKQSISSMDSGTGTLSQLAGVESSLTGGNMMMGSSTAFDLPEPKLNEVSRDAIKQAATGPDGQRLNFNTNDELFYYIDPTDKSKGTRKVKPGSDLWDSLGLNKLQEMQTDNKGME